MHWGGAWGAPWGDADDMVLSFSAEDLQDGLGARVRILVDPDYTGMHWDIVVAGSVRATVLIGADETDIVVPYGDASALEAVPISAVPIGDWTESAGDSAGYQTNYTAANGARGVILRWNAVPQATQIYGDSGKFGAVTLNGVGRGSGKVIPGAGAAAGLEAPQNQFDLVGTWDGALLTVEVQSGGVVLCSGSRGSAGTITLDAVDDSGISGSIYWGGSTTMPEGMLLRVRWPKEYTIYFYPTGGTPAVLRVVADSGRIGQTTTITGIEPGVYDYGILPRSENGAAGGYVAHSVTVYGPPKPITNLRWDSGDFSAPVIAWDDSITTGCTYRIYYGDSDTPVDFTAPYATVAEGAETFTLPAPSSADGVVRVCVEPVLSGSESGYRQVLEIEWADGERVPPRPAPLLFEYRSLAGLVLTCNWYRSGARGVVETTQARLDMMYEDGSTDSNTASVAADRGTVAYTAGVAGWWRYRVVALSAEGVESGDVAWRGPVWIGTAAPSDVAAITAEVV